MPSRVVTAACVFLCFRLTRSEWSSQGGASGKPGGCLAPLTHFVVSHILFSSSSPPPFPQYKSQLCDARVVLWACNVAQECTIMTPLPSLVLCCYLFSVSIAYILSLLLLLRLCPNCGRDQYQVVTRTCWPLPLFVPLWLSASVPAIAV